MDRPPITLAPGIVLPEAEIAEICRRYEIRELAVFGSRLAVSCARTAMSIFWSSFCPEPRFLFYATPRPSGNFPESWEEKWIWFPNVPCETASRKRFFRRLAAFMRRERLYVEDIHVAAQAVGEFVQSHTFETFRSAQLFRDRLGVGLAHRGRGCSDFEKPSGGNPSGGLC
jgi:hypothetical protein